MREPSFWWQERGTYSGLLAPFAALYGAVAAQRMARPGAHAALPVICVGNFTLGGSGKTPTAMAIAQLLIARGERPCFLTRGYGGRLKGPVRVDAKAHRAEDVGDEPLLLARIAPTIVAHDRAAGAEVAKGAGANVVVMDDGLQNPSLEKNLALAVVDGKRGVGNGCVFPAGPLRAPLAAQLERTHALLVIGKISGAADVIAAAGARRIPVFHAMLEPDRAAIAALAKRKVLAFAGIGDPEKFFTTLKAAGIDAPVEKAYPDHHRYTAADAAALIAQAEHGDLKLLTTEKDRARMAGGDALAALMARSQALPVTLALEDESGFEKFLLGKIARSA